ncbi:response regulator transcription factor [Roseateles cellulosilyticus]|uniref:Response regulator transcription factor n=1 Tax=Pelomonas cellulosilytica TaxID=2906762 RepID=A0ABS8Y152_9BURK|nr:response regulator transcription factor [Pelomonas sp. P8]
MKKILIVDDHDDIRRLIRLTLEFEDYDVREACDGPSALDAAREFQPDLVLMDVMMPGGVNGMEACRQLKGGAVGAVPRVMMLSACGQAGDREAGLQAGADLYLVKPFSPLQLIDCIADMWTGA